MEKSSLFVERNSTCVLTAVLPLLVVVEVVSYLLPTAPPLLVVLFFFSDFVTLAVPPEEALLDEEALLAVPPEEALVPSNEDTWPKRPLWPHEYTLPDADNATECWAPRETEVIFVPARACTRVGERTSVLVP